MLTRLAALTIAAAALATTASAEPRHGLSAFGELKYPADFKHFEYVNPGAPKGGRLAMIGTAGRTTFDSFNNYILKGDSAQGLEYLFDSLMTRALDEPDAVYGLVAASAEVALDGKSVTFTMRPEAKFADGTPVTADDVVFSFETLKQKGHPNFGLSLRDVVKAEALDPHTVRYEFTGDLIRDLPLVVAELPILSKAYYTARPFDQTSLDKPLGSGPYEIGAYKAGTFVSYKRRPDYWARDLPVNRGRFNFDELRYDYYRDRTLELEGLKAGSFDFREEFTSIDWATGYDVPAVKEGRLIRLTMPDERPSGAQGFFINTRREPFKDKRVREALGLAFDFEWSNKNLFFELYTRTQSFFENSDMKASGPPSPEELKLLEPYRDRLAPEVFGEPYSPPVTDASGRDRKHLKRARDLLTAAGYGDGGRPLTVEILSFESGFDRIVIPYIDNLKRIGVNASLRRVDPAQYERRMKSFDFDMTTQRYALRLTPGVEVKSYWGSDAAAMDGSFNLAGIKDPVVDALITKVIEAKSRAELATATRALDRVLRAGQYWVPHWYKAMHNVAFWDKYARPAVKPKYDEGVIETWWYDADKAAKLAKN
ncbi:MAG: extracellular solute-binding protein [Hyphomicrobium sp.]|uniref:extracellular solute-binding protein n=1 Tax=Hyphomicrobium sp. TaxID=82 RepID=UPI001325B2A2|nr:extracellular solute-binding protein [Hyphomicrobium sp.]KAB2941775.1 MAG: ABC transporter substrate-binding protein [Hyphomicrobium sp.]MBZ0210055.1 extracellular solute-binding protein [Hyphomicrobium sp.]